MGVRRLRQFRLATVLALLVVATSGITLIHDQGSPREWRAFLRQNLGDDQLENAPRLSSRVEFLIAAEQEAIRLLTDPLAADDFAPHRGLSLGPGERNAIASPTETFT